MILELTPQQEHVRQQAESFARESVAPAAARIDATGQFPADVIRTARSHGFLGMTTPLVWGGTEYDYVSYVTALEAIARASATVAVILAVHNSLVAEVIAVHGSPEQKDRWLRRLATGEALGSFALSERDAGTDAANQQTLAEPTSDGGWRLDGQKVWVANGEVADLAVLFAATRPGARGRGVTAFLVPLDAPGIARVAEAESLGVRGLGCVDLTLDDVRVGSDQVLGSVNAGFAIARWAIEGGRIAIAAQALGVGQAALDLALVHARERRTFGRPIGSFQAIQWMLADVATELDAARLLTLKAAATKDVSPRYALEAAMAKLSASEAAHRAADRALQILASAGYRRGSPAERLFRDARATEIYQGTSEVQRMVIASHILR